LSDYLAGAREYIDLISDYAQDGLEIPEGSLAFSIRANWKLLYENSGDVYHGAPMHRRFFSEFQDMDLGALMNRWMNSPAFSLGNGHSVIMSPNGVNPVDKTANKELSDKLRWLQARYGEHRGNQVFGGVGLLTIFPNLVFVDGQKALRTYYPNGTRGIDVSEWKLMPCEDGSALRQKRLESTQSALGPAGFVTPDDMEAMEECQRTFEGGATEWCVLSRGMKREVPNVLDEIHIRSFYRRWTELMGPQAETVRRNSITRYDDHDDC